MAIYLGSEQVGGGIDALSILDLVYPVGSIYMSVNATDPGTLFGGTWERIQDRFLLAAGSTYAAGGTGGAATVKLTDAQMAHGHSFTQPSVTGGSHNHGIITRLNTGTSTGYPIELSGSAKQGVGKHTESDGGHTHTVSGGAVANLSGASSTRTAHNNMPPYLAVYMWERTA